MATLTGNQIKNSYDGLIKTTDNAALGAVEKEITDGVGTSSTLKLGTTSASFVGDLDLTGATVTGLPDSGVQSVVAGTNVTVDNTDPANPIVNAAASGVTSIIAGGGISVDQATGDVTVTATGGGGGAPSFTLTRYTGTQANFACDTIQASVLIPAGTIEAGDIWELRGMESATDSTGWVYTAFWISTTGTIGTGGTESINLGQVQSADAAWTAGYNKALYVHTADGTGAGTTTWRPTEVSDVASSTYVAGGDPHETWAVDWTVDQYLISRICIDNAGATYTMHGATIHKLG